ncbi:chitin synthase chs-2-like isoform X3 [Mercenaria mercenaria]|uniref:chitin synthase chs-2-like isoform X3 n=1 Tax=Mercenaria mercenaria TaxID=6596 RepID=UPI00234F775E|nr:chitin synthase chs-2-like isoform X3 [Mercenaria mercenaria]
MTEAKRNEESEEWPAAFSARWDRFEEVSEERILSEDHVFWDKAYWVTKVIFSGLLFVLVLCSAVVSKGVLLVLTWNIFTPAEVNATRSGLKTLDGHFHYNITGNRNITLDDGDTVTDINFIWALFLMVVAPNIFTIIFYTWRLIFRKTGKLKWFPLSVALISATLHSIGLSFFAFYLLPSMDPISGLWYSSSITLVPSVVQLAFTGKAIALRHNDTNKIEDSYEDISSETQVLPENDNSNGTATPRRTGISFKTAWPLLASILACVFSATSLCLWGVYVASASQPAVSAGRAMLFILSPILVSFGWWEIFVPSQKTLVVDKDGIKVKNESSENGENENNNTPKESEGNLKSNDQKKYGNTFWSRIYDLKYQTYKGRFKIYTIVNVWKVILTFVLVIVIYSLSCNDSSNCIDALFGKRQQPAKQGSDFFGSTFLLNGGMCQFATPFIVAVIGISTSFFCHRLSVAAIKIVAQIQGFSFPVCLATPVTFGVVVILSTQLHNADHICKIPFPWLKDGDTFSNITYMILASVTGYLSLLFLTAHIWTNRTERMSKENMMFYKPLYCGTFFDHSLILNRCKDGIKTGWPVTTSKQTAGDLTERSADTNSPMGPEAKGTDKSSDTIPLLYLCATMWHETETEMTQLLKSLFRMDIDQCARSIYAEGIHHRDYYNFETHIFFDDAFEEGSNIANQYVETFIRVMAQTASSTYPKHIPLRSPRRRITPYGGRLTWFLPGGNKLVAHLKDKFKIRRKKRWSQVMYMYYFLSHKLDVEETDFDKQKERAKNIFILALDGDVDFRPSAVKLLVDKMKRNDQIGAACGRIHPIGDGPMVWYQKFEYAVSHWLVKATEHITGCVLCSPGCFSLFRGSALMDCNVMRRYTTLPTQARHHIQYDQGEDRWLCTLLLKQGYKVDYCAASDAYTFAPEGFKEFYNQRRRWTPSTMANILDLLSDWKVITDRNDNVSMPYIALQMSWFISSVITPGVLLLMIVGATNLAYPELSLHAALLINLAPVVLFVIICFCAKTEYQLNLAAALSIVYSLVMMIVLVGLIRESVEDGFCSVITLFLLFVSGVFVTAGLTHPKEIGCLIHGFLFFIAIPSMSMLLMIYSITNLNNVSWGTREAPKPGTSNAKNSNKNVVQSFLDKFCGCCQATSAYRQDEVNNKLEEVMSKFNEMESGRQQTDGTQPAQSKEEKEESSDRDAEPTPLPKKDKYSKFLNFNYETSTKLKYLRIEEELFWKWLIKTYLSPGGKSGDGRQTEEEKMKEKLKEENMIKQELKELRNKASVAYLLINALFITIIFFLQQSNLDTNGDLSVKIECGGGDFLEVEPISMAFTVVFGLLLVIQFLCMIVHRLKTFLQINSITRIKQDFDVDQLFMDVVNEILEKKREEAAKEPETLKEPEAKGKQRLKQFIRNNVIKQLHVIDEVLLDKNKEVDKDDIGSSSDVKTSRRSLNKEERKPTGRFKTVAAALGRMSSYKKLKLHDNNSFRQMFQTLTPSAQNSVVETRVESIRHNGTPNLNETNDDLDTGEAATNQDDKPELSETQDDKKTDSTSTVSEEKRKAPIDAW